MVIREKKKICFHSTKSDPKLGIDKKQSISEVAK
jgi:hypothetical protein